MNHVDIITTPWSEYELIDSGNLRKLERFGTRILDRPDPQALWNKRTPEAWLQANAQFVWNQNGERWSVAKDVQESWNISYDQIQMKLSLGQFKHIGIFPEHKVQWEKISKILEEYPGSSMLNLFGYTGAASLVAASKGAKVTHVDASKQTIATVKENAKLSGLADDSLRTIIEDALKYARRLVQRGEVFDIILLDPPAFGRGPKGEVWKIEEKLPELMSLIPELLSPDAKLVILNGYAAGFSARSFGELMKETLQKKIGTISYGDVGIQETASERILSTGIYASWQK